MRAVIVGLGTAVAAFLLVSWWALESGGVAIIETRAPDGSIRVTHVWYSESEPVGELWLEAGSPENGWFEDIQRDPVVRFRAAGRSGLHVAQPVAGSAAHERIRSSIRDKYGLRDHWVNLFIDTSRSVAVRLLPMATDERRPNVPEGRG